MFRQPIRQQTFRPQQRQAQRRVQRAQRRAPQVHALPYVPVLKHYTPAERHYINKTIRDRTVAYARQTGQHPQQALDQLRYSGDQSTRQAIQAYTKSYLEGRRVKDAQNFDRLFGSHPDLKLLTTRAKAVTYRKYLAGVLPHGQAKPGPKPPGGIGGVVATVTPKVVQTLSQGIHPVAGMSWGAAARGAGRLAGPVGSDLLNIGTNLIPSTYQAVKVGAQAIGGNTAPAKKFYAHDPIHQLLTGQFKQAGQTFLQHPLATGLEVAGAKAAVFRGAGGLGRRAGVKAFNVTGRAPLIDEATGMSVPRRYSPDPLNKAVQVAYDRMGARKQQRLLTKAQAMEPASPMLEPGRAAQASELRRQAAQASPTRLPDSAVKRRTAATFGANQRLSSQGRSAVIAEQKALRIPDRYAPLVRLVAEGAIYPTREDAAAYADQIGHEVAQGRYPNTAAREQMLRNQQLLRDAVADPKLDFGRIHPAAQQYAAIAEHGQRALIETAPEGPGRVDRQQQFERRVVMPYAVRRMGGIHDPELGLVGPPTDPAMRSHIAYAEGVARAAREQASSGLPADVARAEQAVQTHRALVKEHYRPLPTSEIQQHMLANPEQMIKNPAYLSQAPGVHGARAFFRAFFNRARMPGGKAFTGAATRGGMMDLHPTALLEQQVRTQQQVEAERGMNVFYQGHGVREPGAKEPVSYQTYGPANDAAIELEARTGEKYVPIRIAPFMAKKAQVEAALEGDIVNEHGQVDSPTRQVLEEALQAEDGPGPWGIVRKASRDEALGQLQALGGGSFSKGLQRVNYQFRQAVLPLSTKWLAGNVIEAALRSAVAGSGPGSYYVGRRLLAPNKVIPGVRLARPLARFEGARKGPVRMPDAIARMAVPALKGRVQVPVVEAAARELYLNAGMTPAAAAAKAKRFAQLARESSVKGGQYASQAYFPYRGSEVFQAMGGWTGKLGTALGGFWRAPGPKQLAWVWHQFTHIVMQLVNARVEDQAQYAMAGKYAKKYLMDPQAIKVSQKAIEQAARGLTDTNEQAAMGRWIERAYGKYQDFPAWQRGIIQTYTPFVPWAFNAINFLYRVLPKDHPVLTGVLASAYIDSQDYLKKHHLIVGGKDKSVPAWLVGSLPTKGGKFIRLSRYTPAGVFQSETGPLGVVADNVLPQISGGLNALKGRSWTGNPLPGKPGIWAKVGISGDQFVESMIPGVAQFHRLVLGSSPSSKKASLSQRLQREWNPFYPVQPSQKGSGFGSGSFNFKNAVPAGPSSGFDFKNAVPVGP